MVIRDNGLKSTKRVLGSRISKYTQWPNENTINDLQNTTQIEEYESKKKQQNRVWTQILQKDNQFLLHPEV